MATELYNAHGHHVLLFSDLVEGNGIQSNQLLVIDGAKSALFDPGGELTFSALNMAMAHHRPIRELNYVLASHQDPDILSSLDSWFRYSDAKVVIPKVWERFLEHLIPKFMNELSKNRFITVPDKGMLLPLGDSHIVLLPAHFLHSVGNLHFYDPISKILFSGDVGASLIEGDATEPVTDFAEHVPSMEGFHRRYMVSNKVCRLWVKMVRGLDIQMIVPQHGRPFADTEVIEQFLAWFERLECGIDWVNESHYQIPTS